MGHVDYNTLSLGLAQSTALPPARPSLPCLPTTLGIGSDAHNLADSSHAAVMRALPKLRTQSMSYAMSSTLRSAPVFSNYRDFGGLCFPERTHGTVDPSDLHFPSTAGLSDSPFDDFTDTPDVDACFVLPDEFPWLPPDASPFAANAWFPDSAVDDTSSSRFSSTSQAPLPQDFVMDMQAGNAMAAPFVQANNRHMSIDLQSLHLGAPSNGLDSYDGFTQTSAQDPGSMASNLEQCGMLPNAPFQYSIPAHISSSAMSNTSSDSPATSTSSGNGSVNHSSVTSASINSLTDAAQQSLFPGFAQPPATLPGIGKLHGEAGVSSFIPQAADTYNTNCPTTADLQRHTNAYIVNFHPHLPFLHTSTLNLDETHINTCLREQNLTATPSGGAGCLILAMAAIGALFEYDFQASRALFNSAKKMVLLYLDERRRVDMANASNGPHMAHHTTVQSTPLWLIQAMLLNVIYGHNCGDKLAAEIASTHCAALVSLARAADLGRPPQQTVDIPDTINEDVPITNDPAESHVAQQLKWQKWRDIEERKRTMYAVYVLSSLLVVAYNRPPAITNTEILLDLPCSEDLWAIDNAVEWTARVNAGAYTQRPPTFANALSHLLSTHQRPARNSGTFAQPPSRAVRHSPELDLTASTFGCLVMINALHTHIWELRNRRNSRYGQSLETEDLSPLLDPALHAWRSMWQANEHHHNMRPNPFGFGPLSADCMPLLDLAFVRARVDLGSSKEAFWQHDFDAMANLLALRQSTSGDASSVNDFDILCAGGEAQAPPTPAERLTYEHTLRNAAHCAAVSLLSTCQQGLTFADASSHELPLQAAMSIFDCSQVLAEWAAALQDRVGRYTGVLGRSGTDFGAMSPSVLLDQEGLDLLHKISLISDMLGDKINMPASIFAASMGSLDLSALAPPLDMQVIKENCLGSRLLQIVACMLERAAIWPSKLIAG